MYACYIIKLATDITERRYKRHRFPAEIIAHAVWLYYHRFPLHTGRRQLRGTLGNKGDMLADRELIRKPKMKSMKDTPGVLFGGLKH